MSNQDWLCAQCGSSGSESEHCKCDECETENCDAISFVTYVHGEGKAKNLCETCFENQFQCRDDKGGV